MGPNRFGLELFYESKDWSCFIRVVWLKPGLAKCQRSHSYSLYSPWKISIKLGGPVTGNTGEIQHPAGVTNFCYSKPFYLKNAGCVNRRIYHGKLSVQRDRSLNLTQQSLWQYPKKTFHLGSVVPWCTPSIGFHPSPSLTIPGVKAGSSQECLTRVGV